MKSTTTSNETKASVSVTVSSRVREIDQLKDEVTVQKDFEFGRFCAVTVVDKTGIKGTGLSRCSEEDSYNKEKGKQIAFGRALRSLLNKRKGIKNRYWYLG